MFFSPRLNSTSIKWIGSPPPRYLSIRYSSRYRHSEVVPAFSGGFAILAGVPAGALDACEKSRHLFIRVRAANRTGRPSTCADFKWKFTLRVATEGIAEAIGADLVYYGIHDHTSLVAPKREKIDMRTIVPAIKPNHTIDWVVQDGIVCW